MSSSERLPSFKGPRDLSLSSRGAKRETGQASSAQARPRRVFTPNIPPKRDRGGTATGSSNDSSGSTVSARKESVNASGSSTRGRPQRGRGAQRGGARPPKQRGELLQTESIFSDGVGDPTEARRNAGMQYKSGYGSRYKSATEGGPSRMSSMNRTTLTTIIKQEDDDESNRKIFGTERFEQAEEHEASSENPHTPIVLPLIGYVPELFMEATTQIKEPTLSNKAEKAEQSIPSTSKEKEKGALSMVKIKEEKLDEDDLPTITQIKKEKIDDTEKELETGRGALAGLSLESTSFAGTYRSAPPDGTLLYFQFPDELPVLEASIRESIDQQDSSKSSTDLVQDINDLPEGFIGRLQILSSGRTRFIIGENTFDVDSGKPVGFRQDLMSVDVETKKLTNLGAIDRKFVVTPEIESLILDAL